MVKNIKDYIPEEQVFVLSTSTFDQDFKYVGREELLRGVYYWESDRSIIYLHRHETPEDLINTCVHETLHHCIADIIMEDDEGAGSLSMDIEQEHDIIRNMAWANYWAVDDYTAINNKLIKSKIQLPEEIALYKKFNKHFDANEDKWI